MKHGSTDYYFKKIIHALLLFCVFGIASVLLDADHALALLQKELNITPTNLLYLAARPLHFPLLVVLGIVCVYFASRVYRLLHQRH